MNTLIIQMGKCGTEKLSNLLNFSQLGNVGIKIHFRPCLGAKKAAHMDY